MKPFLILFFAVALVSCGSATYYISRHGEKAGTTTGDPPLTPTGEKQALALRDYLKGKKISNVYSTNYIRTKATAKPTADEYNLSINVYNAATSTALVDSLKAVNKKNILIIGHSNTVDDIVNRFVETSAVTDLPDSEYGSLFIVKKKGKVYRFEKINLLTSQ